MNFKKIKLKKIERQGNHEFSDKLSRLKYGDTNALDWIQSKMQHITDIHDIKGITIVPTNKVADAINEQKAEQILIKSKITREYKTEHNGEIRSITLAKGMRVMLTRNSITYANGTMGVVERMYKNKIVIRTDDNNLIEVKKRELIHGEEKVMPVCYAYAITANKSQGMTFETDVNIVPGFFDAGQLYVALSRVRNIEQLKFFGLQGFKKSELVVNRKALAFCA